MKYIISAIVLVAFSVSVLAQGIKFEQGTFNQALTKAKAENKVLFIDGYAVWCGPCKKMANTVFKDEEVGNYFDEHLVALKVDVERGEGPVIKEKYGITGLPGYVFIDGDDFVVYRFSSAMPKDEFMKEVKKAVAYAQDKNSVGRMAERYEKEKDNEQFLLSYLGKLKESKSSDYMDILEHYLSIQTSIDESSKEMVTLLADHYKQIIFDGKADEIIQRNYGSDAWKLYVRKDIREIYQLIPRQMVENTTNYAVAKKDTVILEMVFDRAANVGASVGEEQRERVYTYYYKSIGDGENYKRLVRDNIETYISEIDAKRIRNFYQEVQKRKAEGDPEAQSLRPISVRKSQMITMMVNDYAEFVTSEKDKEDVVRWMKVAYYIIPGDYRTMSAYANILYLYGNDKEEAIKIKQQACEIAEKEDTKRVKGMQMDLELMKAGKSIVLK
ncbi:thioredoxin family protein [Carboxylicivirga sediminis]|uniref:Thioredoxin family protein n=1 Tax=Carboxylicivirga sediminis TaxID=2006564 RepID=A0A941IWH5_9BACT|nr:thioredoxin family protein [Carboxylicivirga sediminis]MBR8535801.1 thioredoxin family protein [Carboxylicivirga sediminis]